MISTEIEIAVASYFGFRRNIVVPNVWWGWGIDHEADLIVVSKALVVTEIEIKVSRADLLADSKKQKWKTVDRWGKDNRIARFFYAVPENLVELALQQRHEAGVLSVAQNGKVTQIRSSKNNRSAVKPTKDQVLKLAHLGCMRIWGLKERKAE